MLCRDHNGQFDAKAPLVEALPDDEVMIRIRNLEDIMFILKNSDWSRIFDTYLVESTHLAAFMEALINPSIEKDTKCLCVTVPYTTAVISIKILIADACEEYTKV